MDYAKAHAEFIGRHAANRTGERRNRLERGHSHAEQLFLKNVWWPLRGDFQDLHPEYEVLDWRGRSYFADLAWLPGHVKLLIEIKGYSSHVRDMDRQKFCNELNRETFLYAMGYHVISFAYDDVEQRPELCISLLRMALSRHQPEARPVSLSRLAEKELALLAIQLARPIRPMDVKRHFQIDHRTAVRMLRKLCEKGWLKPSPRGKGERVVRYELVPNVVEYLN
ncbi:MAG TPA: hypothetical protein VF260_08700 [Bacilli bacterium]